VTGPDRRERHPPALEPLELEELDARRDRPAEDEDPDVFDRVTAVPGDLPNAHELDAAAAATQEDETISGLFERAAADTEPPARRTPSSEPPPVLSAPTSSAKRPSRRNSRAVRSPSRPNLERPARRQSTPVEPTIELDIEPPREPEPVRRRDALEVELPVTSPLGRMATLEPPSPSNAPEVTAMKDRYATGDFSGALIVAEGILESNPAHEEALRCQTRCTDVLAQMYLARLGSLTQLVRVALSGDQIRWLSLDHRAGFLLSLIDGESSIETLLDISGMQRLEALRILFGLLDQRVIALSEGQ
jgi:hypothetical protein